MIYSCTEVVVHRICVSTVRGPQNCHLAAYYYCCYYFLVVSLATAVEMPTLALAEGACDK